MSAALRIGWVGFHVEGLAPLRAVLEHGYPIAGVITLDPARAAPKSGAVDYRALCREFQLPLYEVGSINQPDGIDALRELSLDIAFVIGWTELVRPAALNLVRRGMIGAHASLLPRNRGRAPINWAIIRGEECTGNTLQWLAEGADLGRIIDQAAFEITPYDTCASLYEKVADSNRDMILRLMPGLLDGDCPAGTPQTELDAPALPRRRPEDGCLDWSGTSRQVYDLVRAVTHPYPGAFSWMGGERWLVWKCAALAELDLPAAAPGTILGPLISPVPEACGQVVVCGQGAVVLLELEDAAGNVLAGPQLCAAFKKGQRWANGT